MDNYAFGRKPLPDVKNGHVFIRDNFTQMFPHTKLFEGKTGLRFINCKMVNCDLPPDAVCEDCRPYHMDWCANVHPNWIDRGLPECTLACRHAVGYDEVIVDGVSLGRLYQYEDTAVQ